MIRIETEKDWLLLTHRNHARLAGEFARHWKNDSFAPPDPFAHVLDAVARHDDSWELRDAIPLLTADNNPSAFSKELVGTYDAFEEIDLEDYLRVRGEATETAAKRDPFAAILISMHTVNLLTEQADLSTLTPAEAAIHGDFITSQRARQAELLEIVRNRPELADFAHGPHLKRCFEFLQASDNFSLLVGVDFAEPATLRHAHPQRDGTLCEINFFPLGDKHYALDPWPLDESRVEFLIPYRRVPKRKTVALTDYQTAYAEAEDELIPITVEPK